MRILHVFRAPVGGLFRHVVDLAGEQAARGHDVGVMCDAQFAGERNERLLKALGERLSLGIHRTPIQRNPHPSDFTALALLKDLTGRLAPDVLHGHGSKGGLYARFDAIAARKGPIRAYTPHGGSLNHRPGTVIHRGYMMVERMLERGTDLFLFESRFIAGRYHSFVGTPAQATERVVLNGLHPQEFQALAHVDDPADFLFIGEYRFAKGVDTLLAAIARVRDLRGEAPRLMLVGQGPDEAAMKARAADLGIAGACAFNAPMAAREAFTRARTMVVPSRFESMPYVVLEAAGAAMPMISTDVGGIPEIFGAESHRLIPADDVEALVGAMIQSLNQPEDARKAEASRLQAWIQAGFRVDLMTDAVLDGYRSAIAARGTPAALARAV
jgi:glycosyltransferase involved in cell wall biosynthesis